jgi:hypothetical protein
VEGSAVAQSLKKIFKKIDNNLIIRFFSSNSSFFTRRNKLTFQAIVLKILHSFQDSVEFNLSTFLPLLNIPVVTAGAFSIARYKINFEFFQYLNKELNEYIETLDLKLWKGYRVIAGDGTTINLPVHKSTINHFGLFRDSKTGGKTVMANAAMLYDVLNNYVIASNISPFETGEKTIISNLITQTFLDKSIIVLDRHYSNFHILKLLLNNNLSFCVRLKTSKFSFSKQVLEQSEDDFITEWTPSEAERATCKKKQIDSQSIKVRITKIMLPSGEIEVLVTNLFDIEKFSKTDIEDLYKMRWEIEEGYKKLKPKMKLEEFGSKRQEGIYQEFYSHIFMMNITQILCNLSQKKIELKTPKRKIKYKYNWANAFKFIQNEFINLLTNNNIEDILNKLLTQIENSIISIRPNRSFRRTTQSIEKHRYSPMYK